MIGDLTPAGCGTLWPEEGLGSARPAGRPLLGAGRRLPGRLRPSLLSELTQHDAAEDQYQPDDRPKGSHVLRGHGAGQAQVRFQMQRNLLLHTACAKISLYRQYNYV